MSCHKECSKHTRADMPLAGNKNGRLRVADCVLIIPNDSAEQPQALTCTGDSTVMCCAEHNS